MSKIKFKRLPYYFSSFLKILAQVGPNDIPKLILLVMIGPVIGRSFVVKLKKFRLSYQVASWLDLLTLKEVVLDEDYERLVKISSQDQIVVDVGAGFGDFAILVAKKYPQVKVLAIEPNPTYSALLRQNVQLNHVKNVFPYQRFISSLDELFELSPPVKRIDFLKIDCEGCEFSILSSAAAAALDKVDKIALEYHLGNTHDLFDLEQVLKQGGFQVKVLAQRGMANLGLIGAKKIPKEAAQQVIKGLA